MGRIGNYPRTLNSFKRISINFFKRYGLLKEGIHESGSIGFYWNDEKQSEVGYEIDMTKEVKTIHIHYIRTYDCFKEDKSIDYTVKLTYVPSNIGNGKKWYFVCPVSKKRCIYLYESECHDYFLHRELSGAYYDSQIRSKQYRMLDSLYGDAIKYDNSYYNRYNKYRKTHYAGKPTKWYAKYKKIEENSHDIFKRGGLTKLLMQK